MEHKKRKSGGSHKESRDIMPCSHTFNWNSDDQETDNEEGGSDVMELKGARPDKMLFEKTTHDAGPAYSEDIKEVKSCGQIHITNAGRLPKVFVHDKKLCEKITNEAVEAIECDQQTKGRTDNKKEENTGHEIKDYIKSQSVGMKNMEVIRTRSKDKEKNEAAEHKQDGIKRTMSDIRNKKAKQSQYIQSCRSNYEVRKNLRTPSDKKNNDANSTSSTDQEKHEPIEHTTKAEKSYCKNISGQTAIFFELFNWIFGKRFCHLIRLPNTDESIQNDKSRNFKNMLAPISILFDKGIFGKFVCLLMVLLMLLGHVNSYESTQDSKWQLNSTHVVFGESVALKCSLATNICKNDSSRRWSKCRYQKFLITNGISTNPNKYREVLSPDCYTSYLIINNFTKEDMNVEYTFGYSTKEFSRELQLERSMYTRYPENETTTSEVNCKTNNLSFILKLVDVNPVPNCTMVVMNDTLTSEGNVHNTSEYFSNIEYRFHHQLQHAYSKRKMQAWCDFGTKIITVFDDFFKCDDPRNLAKVNTSASLIPILTAIVLTLILILVIIIYNMYLRKRRKDEYIAVAQNGGVPNG